ncbi:hypothetical protein [Streptacidiphilus sp. MAP5-3]|uniref:hypothetical protein n=1 Tax=unclassified Streptacidiphilus TaxID=2643834 RepID=UPI0035140849
MTTIQTRLVLAGGITGVALLIASLAVDFSGSNQMTVPQMPSMSNLPTALPTSFPTDFPTGFPTGMPTGLPTDMPTGMPTGLPTNLPSDFPTAGLPTGQPDLSGGGS